MRDELVPSLEIAPEITPEITPEIVYENQPKEIPSMPEQLLPPPSQ
jgi:hypothetical protein